MALERGKAEAIIRKIVALRALTVENGATEAEATAARRMAEKLMTRNGLTEEQLAPLELDEVEEDVEEIEGRGFPISVRTAAAGLVVAGVVAVVGLMRFDAGASGEARQPDDALAVSLREIALGAGVDSRASALRLETVPDAGRPDSGGAIEMAAIDEPPIPLEAAAGYLSEARISLYYETEAAAAQAERLAAIFQQGEAGRVEMKRVEIKIARTHVRYFSPEGRIPARAALALLDDAVTDPGARGTVDRAPRDFSSFTPAPAPNTIEIWMSSL